MRKALICFEGASGIGKTILSNLFSKDYTIIPEVNELFMREEEESKYWYYEKQVERYQLGVESSSKSILDGDIFQPIWYNWIYKYPSDFASREEIIEFYQSKILSQEIAFPDLYIILKLEEKELRKRKEKDKTRRRRNFEKHLKFIEPQLNYYRFLKEHTDIEVEFLNSSELEITKNEAEILMNKVESKRKDDLAILNQITKWQKMNEVSPYLNQ